MNVKILLFPLALVIVIWLAIWEIAPNYSTMKQQSDLLAKDQQKLAVAQQKNSKADQLATAFTSDTEDRNVIFTYLPGKKNEEEIISTIDAIAYSEGVAIYGFSIADTVKNNTTDFPGVIPGTSYLPTAPIPPQAMQNPDGAPMVPPIAGMENSAVYPSPNEVNIGLDFVTNYDKLKSFLAKLSNLKRFNKINSLKIGKAGSNDKNADPNSLQISLGLTFNYLSIDSSKAILSEATFQVKEFDMEAINSVKTKLNTDISPVNVGQKGKANPFLP